MSNLKADAVPFHWKNRSRLGSREGPKPRELADRGTMQDFRRAELLLWQAAKHPNRPKSLRLEPRHFAKL